MSSPLGITLSGGPSATKQRALRALESLGCYVDPFDVAVTRQRQASALVAVYRGVHVLISYATPVAYVLPDGSAVAVTRGHYSRTTNKSVDEFARNYVRMSEADFRDALRCRIGGEK